MTPEVENKVTVTFKDSYGDDMYLNYATRRSDSSWATSADEERESSIDISHLTFIDQIDIMASLEREYAGTNHKLIKIETITTEMDFSSDEYKEAIQKNALRKLSMHEIEALGLGKIALYIKTKYHAVLPNIDSDNFL